MKNKFVILSTQRSGSTFLRTWLNNHPQIRAHDELFLNRVAVEDDFESFLARSALRKLSWSAGERIPFLRSSIRDSFLRKTCSDKPISPPAVAVESEDSKTIFQLEDSLSRCTASAVGFKLMYNQLEEHPSLHRWLIRKNVFVIHLVRTNVIDIVVSRTMAERTGRWHSTSVQTQEDSHEAVALDIGPASSACVRIRKSQAEYHSIFSGSERYLAVSYETLTSHRGSEAFRRILAFLTVDDSIPVSPPALRKVITRSPETFISNFSMLEAEFAKQVERDHSLNLVPCL